MIPFLDLFKINQRFEVEFQSVFKSFLNSGHYILGSNVNAFEDEFASYCGVSHCIGVGNGLDALRLILEGYIVLGQLKIGDEVIVASNTYIATVLAIKQAGLVPKLVESESVFFNFDLEHLASLISKKTKMIAVCHPNNPTGSIVTADNMRSIIDIASENDCWILSDEVYRGAELNGIESPSFYGSYEKTIVNAGLSKAYRLPGLRLGWTVGPRDYIEKAWAFHDYTSISIAFHSDWVASKILKKERRKEILDGTKKHLNENLNTLREWVGSLDGKLSMNLPQAGAIAFVRIHMNESSEKLTYHIRDNFSVLLTAGKWFGLEGFLRFGYGPPNQYLSAALERIGTSLKKI